MKIRVGFGYDVHKLVEGRELWLGGIRIEHTMGLLGHSDADVLIHAICDALLGAANMRDIGYHFPDTAGEYKGIDSKILLRKTMALLREAGYEIRIMEDMTAARKACVEANTEYVKRNVRFNGRHDGDAEYAEFLNAILDYEADGDYEALYAVCRAVAYMRRKYRLDVDGKT